jgi:dTDP-4-amino-4,6-dideoxygalactose transaminase
MKIFDNKKYPNSKYLSRYGFYIPSYIDIKKRDMDYIISIIKKIIK